MYVKMQTTPEVIASMIYRRNRTIAWMIVLSFLLLLLAVPRFARLDTYVFHSVLSPEIQETARRFWFIGEPPANPVRTLYDPLFYAAYTQYLRGDSLDSSLYVEPFLTVFNSPSVQDALEEPFVYRPVVPWLASLIPLPPLISLAVVNLVFLLGGLYALYFILKRFDISYPLRILGCSMYVFSLPVLSYASVGYVDGATAGVVSIATLAIVSLKKEGTSLLVFAVIAIVLLVGPLIKETSLVLLPVLFFQVAYLSSWRKALPILLLVSGVTIGLLYLARVIAPVEEIGHIWGISASRHSTLANWQQNTINNINRFGLRILLSLGFPYLILPFLVLTERESLRDNIGRMLPLLAGLGAVLAISVYGLACCMVAQSGRIIWLSYPFIIPLAMFLLQSAVNHRRERRRLSLTTV